MRLCNTCKIVKTNDMYRAHCAITCRSCLEIREAEYVEFQKTVAWTPDPDKAKTCKFCTIQKTNKDFNKAPHTKDHLTTNCKACLKAKRAAKKEAKA